jgi:hypothetical protein
MTLLLAELNRYLALFSASQKAFMRREQRAHLRSLLFDVPRRSSIGWHCIYETGAQFLRELTAAASPEEIGRRMKRLCSRPYYLQLSILMSGYFGARQQLLLDAGLSPGQPFPGEKLDDASAIVDFWRRCAQAYRNDGNVLPAQGNDTQPILPPATVATLNKQLQPATVEQRKRVRRMAATLELYSFILHGEQRDGMFAHGPYDAGDGSIIVVQEFNDLQNEFLPWAKTPTRNPYPHLAIVMRLRNVQATFSLFGSVLFDPPDILPHIEAEAIFTRSPDGAIVTIPFTEVDLIQRQAAAAQNEIYQQVADWTPRYKAEYGVHLFANHLRTFFELVGLDADARIRAAFESAAAPLIGPMLENSSPPSIWHYMATTDLEYFWPLVATEPMQAPV